MKVLIIILGLFSFQAMASVLKFEIRFKDAKIKQGAIVPATIIFDAESSQKLPLNKLVGETLGNHFYIYNAKPLITKDNWTVFESEANVIVGKIPESEPVAFKQGDSDIMITWNDVEFVPTEAPKELIYGTFEIPSRAQILRWLLILGTLILVGLGGWKIKQKLALKNAVRKKRAEIKDQVVSAQEYEDVVKLWQKKATILREFPSLEENFKDLETVLFKYQFKPSQSESEKIQVMNAYRDFISKSLGGLNGV